MAGSNQAETTTEKKVYVTNHGDLKGFMNESDNPRAPKANMELRITLAGLEAWKKRLEDANVTEGDIEYVLFSHEGTRSDRKGEYCFLTAMESRPQQGQQAVKKV